MAMDHCNTHHGVKATGKCPACHKPTCPQCRTRDMCCSEKCYTAKTKFATVRIPPKPKTYTTSIFTFLFVVAAAYGAAKYLGYL